MKYINYLCHGRSGKISDVGIDFIGISIGICCLMLCKKILIQIKNKSKGIAPADLK